jgi:histidinol dehydrogenase
VAGVAEIAVCAPPGPDGEVNAAVLGACRLAGASVVYRMGGAQAIAALAYGTESVAAVDVIVGPGNLYVQEAKRQVFGTVAIDGFAGPSDLVVIASGDGEVDAEVLVLDLLAQAEHGAGSIVIAISDSVELLDALTERIEAEPHGEALVRLVHVSEVGHALAISEAFAPEHLQLVGSAAEAMAPDVRNVGCLLVGADSGTAFSDYIAGSNHVLPTNGAARFASPLSPRHFLRRFAEVRIGSGAADLAREAAPVARSEGFELHARSMEARIRDNGV